MRSPHSLRAPPLRAVFLDAGGTLVREIPSRAEIYAGAALARGRNVPAPAMRELMYRTHDEMPRSLDGHFRYSQGWFRVFIERIFGERLGLGAREVREVQEELLARFADPATFALQPGAGELLGFLRERGLVTGVISNWGEPLAGILRGLGIGESLDFVLASAVERCEKPEPEIFARALALARVEPAEAVHAGNDPRKDVQGPRALGILPVLVAAQDSESLPGVERVRDLEELQRWIEARLG
jgi:putative hydrolase of the HAD superfamily